MKTYKVKKWPWYRFGSICGISKEDWDKDLYGEVSTSKVYIDNDGSKFIFVNSWAVPIKYCTEIKK